MHTLTIIKKDKKTLVSDIEKKTYLSKYNGEKKIAEELWRAENARYDLTIKKSWIL